MGAAVGARRSALEARRSVTREPQTLRRGTAVSVWGYQGRCSGRRPCSASPPLGSARRKLIRGPSSVSFRSSDRVAAPLIQLLTSDSRRLSECGSLTVVGGGWECEDCGLGSEPLDIHNGCRRFGYSSRRTCAGKTREMRRIVGSRNMSDVLSTTIAAVIRPRGSVLLIPKVRLSRSRPRMSTTTAPATVPNTTIPKVSNSSRATRSRELAPRAERIASSRVRAVTMDEMSTYVLSIAKSNAVELRTPRARKPRR